MWWKNFHVTRAVVALRESYRAPQRFGRISSDCAIMAIELVSVVVDEREELFESLDDFGSRMQGLMVSQGMSFVADLELSFTQVRTLTFLMGVDPMPISSVAESLGVSVHAAGRNINRLVRLQLVERRENPEDRRVKLVSVSPQGRQLLRDDAHRQREVFKAFAERVPAEQVRAFNDVLQQILAGDYFAPVVLHDDSRVTDHTHVHHRARHDDV